MFLKHEFIRFWNVVIAKDVGLPQVLEALGPETPLIPLTNSDFHLQAERMLNLLKCEITLSDNINNSTVVSDENRRFRKEMTPDEFQEIIESSFPGLNNSLSPGLTASKFF